MREELQDEAALRHEAPQRDTEIAQKRAALENVLIPHELLLASGFRHVDVFFKWYDFCGRVAAE
jgi:tRNA (cmo5U34)-methyltransferase